MHRAVDIAAGMVVNHEFPVRDADPGSLLNWIPKAYVESLMGGNIRVVIGKSESLKWMLKGTKFDNNMLAITQIKDEFIPEDHMDGFHGRIIKLMVELSSGCDELMLQCVMYMGRCYHLSIY